MSCNVRQVIYSDSIRAKEKEYVSILKNAEVVLDTAKSFFDDAE